jgi:hypothetical protein
MIMIFILSRFGAAFRYALLKRTRWWMFANIPSLTGRLPVRSADGKQVNQNSAV